jgi:hypothetical protein
MSSVRADLERIVQDAAMLQALEGCRFFSSFSMVLVSLAFSPSERLKKNYSNQNIVFWNSLRGLRMAIEVSRQLRGRRHSTPSVDMRGDDWLVGGACVHRWVEKNPFF